MTPDDAVDTWLRMHLDKAPNVVAAQARTVADLTGLTGMSEVEARSAVAAAYRRVNGHAPEPLRPTTARWLNRRREVRDKDGQPGERWSKVLAHKGSYDQFGYGTDTPSDWGGPLQVCFICSRWSGTIAVDVDDERAYMSTRTAQYLRREHALTTRGGGFHVLVDARSVPPDQWPKQGPIPGADIKSNGFIPVPGCLHWSEQRYEPVLMANGLSYVAIATPELIAAINADRAGHHPGSNGNSSGGGHGGGHDGEVAAAVVGMCLRRLRAGAVADTALKEDVYSEWLALAVPRDPDWPFTRDDFERHYRGGLAKAMETVKTDQPVTEDAMQWARSTMARPVTCAEAEQVYARWLHDPDPVPTRIVLATYAANMGLSGDPVWVMLVGGSGIGKTERIMPVTSMPHVVMASALTGEAALLSASPKRERAANATGGVLRQVGERGVLVVKDFTSVLSMSRERRAEVVAALREVYDGRWDRHYGTDGGQVLTWQGHLGFIAGCTTAIDGAHAVLDQMGTRFLFIRLADADRELTAQSALMHSGNEDRMRRELAEATTGLLGSLGKPHELHDGARTWIGSLANLASLARSPVERDYQGEISLVLDPEAPTRIAKQLGQLWRACGMLGLDEYQSWEAVRRAGLDSIPKLRRAVITYLGRMGGVPQPTTAVAQAVDHPSRTTRRSLEDLAAHQMVERTDDSYGTDRVTYSWALSARALTWWNALNR